MKIKHNDGPDWLRALLLTAFGLVQVSAASAQGTTFTYQGQLSAGGQPANGSFDFQFAYYQTQTGGSIADGPVTKVGVGVTNGLFTVQLNYGNVFNGLAGTNNWLDISVRTSGGGPFVELTPRQQITPTPFAIYAEAAGSVSSNTITPVQISAVNNASNGYVLGYNGGSLVWQNPATAVSAWGLFGNSGANPTNGQFVGTLDNEPLELRVGGTRAFRLEPNGSVPNVIGGYSANAVLNGAVAATIGGGGANDGNPNFISSTLGTIAGGSGNIIGTNSNDSTIGGGRQNKIDLGAWGAVIAGGHGNWIQSTTNSGGGVINSSYSVISGGYGNTIQSDALDSAIVGGNQNVIATNAQYATVVGGIGNTAAGSSSFAAGADAAALHDDTFVWNDGYFVIGQGGFKSTGPNQFLVHASGGLGINTASPQAALTVNGSIIVDSDGLNNGFPIANGLTFGGSTGEGIGSVRTAATDQNGLNFYTDYTKRLTIVNNGNVGIGTSSPQQALDVNGKFLVVEGLGAEQAYLGGDGVAGNSGLDVQIGSLNTNVSVVSCFNAANNSYMHLNVSSISILGGADLAEPFAMSQDEILPGSVVVIDNLQPGKLKLTNRPYDKCVAGIVSGANGINPGVSMQQAGVNEAGKNVALSGRVYVRADSSNGAINPGDLLTTSATPGVAMKVTDYRRAQGAVIGKAMTYLSHGSGMVLTLVTLQ